jgi:hypothetical protein
MRTAPPPGEAIWGAVLAIRPGVGVHEESPGDRLNGQATPPLSLLAAISGDLSSWSILATVSGRCSPQVRQRAAAGRRSR